MKKRIPGLLAVLLAVVSCDIYPVTREIANADMFGPTPTANTTIAQLKSLYKTPGQAVLLEDDLVIGGQIVSSDVSGNVYRSFYIQDETGAIEVKIGKSSL